MSLSLQKGQGIELRRRRQTFQATNTGDFVSTSSSQIRIEINVDKETMDFDTGYLIFDFSAAKTGTTDDLNANAWTASTWIKDLRVYDRAGREIGEQVRQYNGIARKHYELLGNDGANANYLNVLEGAAGVLSAASATISKREYAHKFLTHIFDLKSYFPAQKMGGLVIELDMEDTVNVLHLTGGESTDTIDSYTISNVRYVCDLVLLKDEPESTLDRQIREGGLEIHYDSPMNSSQAFLANDNQTFDLGVANGHIKSIQTYIVKDSDRGVDKDFWGIFSQNGLTAYRFRLGSEYLTERDIKISSARLAEYLIEFLKSENLDSGDLRQFYGDSALVLSNFFVIGQKVEVSKDPNVASGRRDFQSNKVQYETTSSGAVSGTLYTNIMLDKVLLIMPNREFKNMS